MSKKKKENRSLSLIVIQQEGPHYAVFCYNCLDHLILLKENMTAFLYFYD